MIYRYVGNICLNKLRDFSKSLLNSNYFLFLNKSLVSAIWKPRLWKLGIGFGIVDDYMQTVACY